MLLSYKIARLSSFSKTCRIIYINLVPSGWSTTICVLWCLFRGGYLLLSWVILAVLALGWWLCK